MPIEVTVTMRFEDYDGSFPPPEDEMRATLEDEFDCVVVEYGEEDV